MSNILTWKKSGLAGYIAKNNVHTNLKIKPVIGFDYDDLLYQENGPSYKSSGRREDLTKEDKVKVKEFIANFDVDKGDGLHTIFGVGPHGEFLGIGRMGEFERYATTAPGPGYHYYNFTTELWSWVYAVDEVTGEYIGNIEPREGIIFATEAPPLGSIPQVWNSAKHKWVKEENIVKDKARHTKYLYEKITEIRNALIPPLLFQDNIYHIKALQAERVLSSDFDENTENYEFIKSDFENAPLTDPPVTLEIAAQAVLLQRDAYVAVAEKTELYRRQALAAIELADTTEKVEAAYNQYITLLSEIELP